MANDKTQEIPLGIVRFEYGDHDRPQRAMLELQTRKHFRGGLISEASVYWHGVSSKTQCISIGSGCGSGDFSKRLAVSPKVRATQKSIDTQHAGSFTPEVIADLTREAIEYYAPSVTSGVDSFGNKGYVKVAA